jgi:kynurenine formamidase
LVILAVSVAISTLGAPPPHAAAAKKKGIQATVNSHESADYGFFDLSYVKIVDLSQPFEDSFETPSEGPDSCRPARTGTLLHGGGQHFDTRTADQLPLDFLMGPAVVIDVSEEVKKDPSYVITSKFLAEWEAARERMPKNAYVLFRTGWSEHWGDEEAYLATGEDGKPAYPTLAADAARLLIKGRKVFAIGIDGPCPDGGTGGVHENAEPLENVILENLTNLDVLPELGAWILAFPPKLEDRPVLPVRVIALVRPEESRPPFIDD